MKQGRRALVYTLSIKAATAGSWLPRYAMECTPTTLLPVPPMSTTLAPKAAAAAAAATLRGRRCEREAGGWSGCEQGEVRGGAEREGRWLRGENSRQWAALGKVEHVLQYCV